MIETGSKRLGEVTLDTQVRVKGGIVWKKNWNEWHTWHYHVTKPPFNATWASKMDGTLNHIPDKPNKILSSDHLD